MNAVVIDEEVVPLYYSTVDGISCKRSLIQAVRGALMRYNDANELMSTLSFCLIDAEANKSLLEDSEYGVKVQLQILQKACDDYVAAYAALPEGIADALHVPSPEKITKNCTRFVDKFAKW